ncbi:MAG: EamA family transporter [Chitinophagaceae bacterium]
MPPVKNKPVSSLMVILAFATVYIVWGSTYLFIQKAVNGFPPFLLGAIRFLTAGLILMSWCLLKGDKVFVKEDIKHAAISGILLLFVGNGIVIWVEQFLPTSMVAIILSSSPIWFVLLDKPKWSVNFKSKATLAGLVTGFAGVVLLFIENFSAASSLVKDQSQLAGLVLLIFGAIAWAGGSLYAGYKSRSGSAPVNSTWQMMAAGLAFTLVSLVRGEAQHLQWNTIPAESWLSLLYLIFFGSIAAFSAYVWLLQVRPATQVSTYAYVNPVVAVLLGVWFANESISFYQTTGLVIILGSVLLINLVKYRKEHGASESLPQPSHSLKMPREQITAR